MGSSTFKRKAAVSVSCCQQAIPLTDELYGKQTLRQVLQSVADFKTERSHSSGQNNRHCQFRQTSLQIQSRIHHRIGAVRDDNRSILFQYRSHHTQDENSIVLCHLQAVFIHQRDNIHFTIGEPQELKVTVNLAIDVCD